MNDLDEALHDQEQNINSKGVPPSIEEDATLQSEEVSQKNDKTAVKEDEVPPPKPEHKNRKSSQPQTQQSDLVEFKKEIEKLSEPLQKLQLTIEFMEKTLAQKGSPHFKNFWEARSICIELFKENIPAAVRIPIWKKYSELSDEARRLKEIFNEQSAFAGEQIDIAIKALEDEIQGIQEAVASNAQSEGGVDSEYLKEDLPVFMAIQGELNVLNTLATRINALRKELIQIEMRIRQKNKFFQRLSKLGDAVFPRRKELIKEISDRFVEVIERFIQEFFSQDNLTKPFYYLRTEIKGLQALAKELTLNTYAFTHTRLQLSECWDKVKLLEKEVKKEKAQKSDLFRDNANEIEGKINNLKEEYQGGKLTPSAASERLGQISKEMREKELAREHIRKMRSELDQLRKEINDKQRDEAQRQKTEIQEKENQRKDALELLKNDIQAYLDEAKQQTIEEVEVKEKAFREMITSGSFYKGERLELERILHPLKYLLAEKREEALLQLSDDDQEARKQLKEVLKQRKQRRTEIKDELERLRKASGASGLDFEQAMHHTRLMSEEKERLESIDRTIKETEDKLTALEKSR